MLAWRMIAENGTFCFPPIPFSFREKVGYVVMYERRQR